ncbi:uncharacterized protein LOC116850772 [Odontomachus brunneus]|uniref:uncharacterized protein LOC116850772 n=1 Tax=Odontomachus brunneus TaxID=486640 RepID=UPI0013F1CDEA|nr:uncharacterized protein LOC116850772 [Odontomachus brunneus]
MHYGSLLGRFTFCSSKIHSSVLQWLRRSEEKNGKQFGPQEITEQVMANEKISTTVCHRYRWDVIVRTEGVRKIFARFPLPSKDGRLRTSRRRRRDQYSEFVYSLGPGTSTFRAGNSPSHRGGKESSCSVGQIHPAISESIVTILSLSRAPRRLHRARNELYLERQKRSSAFYRVITECRFEEPDFHDDPEPKSLMRERWHLLRANLDIILYFKRSLRELQVFT